jgi:hypothetical protein
MNNMPASKPYAYQGDGISQTPEQARAALATSQAARAAATNGLPVPTGPAPTLKGAVKVGGFPATEKYPFRAIARDGGVWQLDPAYFKVKAETIRTSAASWATHNGFRSKTVAAKGFVYVQFSARAGTP